WSRLKVHIGVICNVDLILSSGLGLDQDNTCCCSRSPFDQFLRVFDYFNRFHIGHWIVRWEFLYWESIDNNHHPFCISKTRRTSEFWNQGNTGLIGILDKESTCITTSRKASFIFNSIDHPLPIWVEFLKELIQCIIGFAKSAALTWLD